MRWTIAQVAGALGTRPGAGLDPLARLAGVSIDSRAIRAGELFVAIHGPRHDGHDHVASALNLGALAAVVAEAHLARLDRKSTRLNSSHGYISYAVFCFKKKKITSVTTYAATTSL